MRENGLPRNPGPPQYMDSQPSERLFDLSEFACSSEESSRFREALQQDEILRSEGSGRSFNRVGENEVEDAASTPDPGARRVERASMPTDDTHQGWLPAGQFLTLKELSTALIIAEVFWIVSALILETAEKLVDLPELVSHNEMITALLLGVLCGLYALFRGRGRRLAWRSHLRGKR